MIDFLASRPHFCDHLAPIWQALPVELRGTFFTRPHNGATARAEALGLDPQRFRARPRGPVVVASFQDVNAAGTLGRVALLEHGSGQSYGPARRGEPGGPGFGHVSLFLCPSTRVADRWRARYPGTPAEVVGVAKLDPWIGGPSGDGTGFRRSPCSCPSDRASCGWHGLDAPPVTLAVSFHWPNTSAPGRYGDTALEHYRPHLPQLVQALGAREDRVIGHAHPRIAGGLRHEWERRCRVEFVEHFDDVLDRADVFAVDNSSTLFEFAATGRPVVVLNAPWYRRDGGPGLRFWEFADVGVQVGSVAELVAEWPRIVADAGPLARQAREVAAEVYAGDPFDGRASARAAAAVAEWARPAT